MRPEARVGLLVVAAAAILVVTLVLLGYGVFRPPGYTLRVVFTDAEGLTPGTPVRMAGVEVGTVESLQLTEDHRAEARVRIRPEVRIPRGTTFQVASSTLLGNRFLAVVPGPGPDFLAPGEVVTGQPPTSVDAAFRRLDEVAQELQLALRDIRRAVRAVEGLVANLDATVTDVRQVVTDPRFTESLKAAAAHVEAAAAEVEAVVSAAGRDVRHTAQTLATLSEELLQTSKTVRRFVEDASGDGELAARVRRTAASVEQVAARLEAMARTLQEGLVREDQLREVRGLVQDARRAVQQVEAAAREVGGASRRIGEVAERAGAGIERIGAVLRGPEGIPLLPSLRLVYELGYDTQVRFRHDLDLWILPEDTRYYRLGLHDVGQSNRLNLQVGFRLSEPLSWRAGILQSQVGVGLDYRFAQDGWLRLDLYDLNRPTLDISAYFGWTPNWALGLHVRGLLQLPSYGLGIQYRF